uniref:Uncharacterized protein n=2 Tax=Meloidogyne TaxID=189290 RepID=A0A6V7VD09_MELEN|nr:unnamed protein product [Meloidogyne enterolobii]
MGIGVNFCEYLMCCDCLAIKLIYFLELLKIYLNYFPICTEYAKLGFIVINVCATVKEQFIVLDEFLCHIFL